MHVTTEHIVFDSGVAIIEFRIDVEERDSVLHIDSIDAKMTVIDNEMNVLIEEEGPAAEVFERVRDAL